jgi:hypothetical protein
MPDDHVINLTDSDSGSNKLKLSDNDTTLVSSLHDRWISWNITDPKIESFIIVGKKTGHPFKIPPTNEHSRSVNLQVRLFRWEDWEYTIIWRDKKTHTDHTYDPIISIKPTPLAPFLFILFIGLGVILIKTNFFRKKSNRRPAKDFA